MVGWVRTSLPTPKHPRCDTAFRAIEALLSFVANKVNEDEHAPGSKRYVRDHQISSVM